MASTRSALREIESNVDESMGVRQIETRPQFSPVASAKDIGRVPLRKFGQVEIDRIVPDPDQPRTEFDAEELEHLARSIREKGQLHPIRIRWEESLEKWVIVTGERRWRATKEAGLDKIDCYFVEGELNRSEILEQQLVENLLRQDLKPLDEARGYSALMELNEWNGKQVAAALNVSTSKVSRALALLDLPEELRRKVETGVIPRTTAYELTKLESDTQQRDVANRAAAGTLNYKQTVGEVRQRKGKKARKPRGIHQTFLAENGIKVTVSAPRQGNYHEVEEALQHALEEVRLRIDNKVVLI